MTLEEKAKAYDRALEIAKVWCKLDNNDLSNDDLETLFPELKKSEDERISKEIIKYLEQTVPHHHRDEVLKSKEWIAWLEKQNDNTLNSNIKSCIEMILTDADEQRFKDYNTNLAVCLAWLKRQDEEKPIDWSDYDKTMAFTLMRDVDQMTCISKEAKNERIGWLNSLDEKFINYD